MNSQENLDLWRTFAEQLVKEGKELSTRTNPTEAKVVSELMFRLSEFIQGCLKFSTKEILFEVFTYYHKWLGEELKLVEAVGSRPNILDIFRPSEGEVPSKTTITH